MRRAPYLGRMSVLYPQVSDIGISFRAVTRQSGEVDPQVDRVDATGYEEG
jgi:hypothetical protein